MKITTSKVTKKTIIGVDGLDAINIFIEPFELNSYKARLTIECFGEAWTHYWCNMGVDFYTFFMNADTDYLVMKLLSQGVSDTVIDYDKISKETGIEDIDEYCLFLYEKDLENFYGEDWMFRLPTKKSIHYLYLEKIVNTVKKAFELDHKQNGL